MAVALGCVHAGRDSVFAEKTFLLCAPLLAFVLCNSAPPFFKLVFHPIFAGVAGSWLAIAFWAKVQADDSFHDVLVRYTAADGAGPLMLVPQFSDSSFERSEHLGESLSPEQLWLEQGRRQERQEKRRRRAKREVKVLPGSLADCDNMVECYSSASLDENYTLCERIGKGSYSSVSRCVHVHSGTEHALKSILRRRAPSAEQLQEELEITKLLGAQDGNTDLQHPNIVQLFDVYEDSSSVHLVLELCRGGQLMSLLARLPDSESLPDEVAARLARQMASSLQHLHSRSIAHRDLKPENFMAADHDEGGNNNSNNNSSKLAVATLKMIDFGLSRRFVPGQPMKTLACTSHYVAPEVLEGQYTESCDLWSLGVSIYVLLCRSLPFAAEGEAEVLRK
ncbi:unnamed protein product, partial [Polarella glacialis]